MATEHRLSLAHSFIVTRTAQGAEWSLRSKRSTNRKRHRPEEVVAELRQADEALHSETRELGRRSDVYPVGSLGFERLTNRAPTSTSAQGIVEVLQRGSSAFPSLRTVATRAERCVRGV